ncbi:unnamed protein product [Paramecium sonneborni]|uniref:Uncharacterized protein n=1 Tax=Paramecium sonneborni TaxID=65129 RepID=A0A8S1Q499_9CILI|nr:unnamed protein product [Paramecium sonneborni]
MQEKRELKNIQKMKQLKKRQLILKILMKLLQNEELQTAVIHNVAEFQFRFLLVQQIGNQDIPWQFNFTDICQQLETQIIETINPQLPQLEVYQY